MKKYLDMVFILWSIVCAIGIIISFFAIRDVLLGIILTVWLITAFTYSDKIRPR